MKASKAILVILILASILAGFTVAQQIISKTISGSVTIRAIGNLGFYDGSSNPITSLNFGTLDPEQSWVKTMYVKNDGNTPLYLTAQRNDSLTSINSAFQHLDGTDFQASTPKLLDIDESIGVKIVVWSVADAVAGSYSPVFLFTGTDS